MSQNPLFKAYFALALVCFFWGTTYLGIRMALESFPPLVLVSIRFLISGGILLAFALARGMRLPKGRAFILTAGSGILTLGVGNGCLVWAEMHVSSGIAGLLTTISPFWLVGIEALMSGAALLGLSLAASYSDMNSNVELVAAWLLVGGVAATLSGGTLNWLQKVGDPFAEKPAGFMLQSVGGPVMLVGGVLLAIGVLMAV